MAEDAHGLTLGAWTLTWLEGRPVAEHPGGVRVALRADGTVSTESDSSAIDTDDDDDWLS
ncbi:hypothetical protein C7K25_12500 [Gulosibacter molinativorax]|uniref:Uncharacterized protein n=1 Tax=Gulosibacter molinativorax TaxID=256821 RepID=A0ABT7CAN5_9MICO|nr:hypothetical protein [Gulosibacter molinativorax]